MIDNKKIEHVQSYILNISFPTSFEEILDKVAIDGCLDMTALLSKKDFIWTAPRWATAGDVIFFTHAKTARAKISKLKTIFNEEKYYYSDYERSVIQNALTEGKVNYDLYNGKIFAVARLKSDPEFIEDDLTPELHHASRIYAKVSNLTLLEVPISVDDCKDSFLISKVSSITPIYGSSFEFLKNKILTNRESVFLETLVATPIPLKDINSTNWLSIANKYRNKFMLESQFRHYFVDYFLDAIADKKPIYKECRCKKKDINDSFIDNVIYIAGKYLPVEVKLNVNQEKDLRKQVRKYCHDESIELKPGKLVKSDEVHNNYVLIIDTNSLMIYDYERDEFIEVTRFSNLKSTAELLEIKRYITNIVV